MTEEQLKPGTRVEWHWNSSCEPSRVIPATVTEWTKNKKWVWIEFVSRGSKLQKMVKPLSLRIVTAAWYWPTWSWCGHHQRAGYRVLHARGSGGIVPHRRH